MADITWPGSPLAAGLKARFEASFPLRFALLAGTGLAAWFGLPAACHRALALGFASLTHGLLEVLGVASVREGVLLSRPGVFGMEVAPECTALQYLVLFAAAVLAYPAPPGSRSRAIAAAAILLPAINVARLTSLFVIGVRAPRWFDMAHHNLWQIAGYVALVGAWWLWVRSAGAGSQGRDSS